MANSMATLSRRLYRALLSQPKLTSPSPTPFSSAFIPDPEPDTEEEEHQQHQQESNSSSLPQSPSSSPRDPGKRFVYDRPLENGLDAGIYKAILVGMVGQPPLQKVLKSGVKVTVMSVGTGGIRNNRRPLDNEEPVQYANRCSVQWHRVSVYPQNLGDLVMRSIQPGSLVYLEGNLETKIFSDPVTGLVRSVREVAIRRNGRLVFLSKGGDDTPANQSEMRRVGFY